jgi:folate-binding protein YgfZ
LPATIREQSTKVSMHLTEWHQFLLNTYPQVQMQDDQIASFADPAKEHQAAAEGTVVCDLSHLGLLQVKGADAVTFLQGQVTNDVRLLNGSNAHYTGYCSPKGRLLALFLAFKHGEHLHLQLPKTLVAPIMKRLKMFVMRSKVEIEDASENIIKLGVSGPDAETLLAGLFSQIPTQDYAIITLENCTLVKLPGASRYEVFLDPAIAPDVWTALTKVAIPVGALAWEWLEIQAGIPEIYLQTQDAFVPQMLNLDALQAINYKKGCYTGQEIVARTHYLGKVKRRTQLAHIESDIIPQMNDDVMDANGQAVGKIVRSAPAQQRGYDVLAECRLENVGNETVYWNSIPLSFKTLPYTLEAA